MSREDDPVVLRWQATDDLRRSWTGGPPDTDLARALSGFDGFGWRTAVHRDDRDRYEAELRAVAGRSDERVVDVRVVTDAARVTHLRETLTGHPAGDVVLSGMPVDITDLVTALRQTAVELDDMHAFDELTRLLASVSSIEDLVKTVEAHCTDLVGTINIAVLLASDDRNYLSVYQGLRPAAGTTDLRYVDLSSDTPAGKAALTGRPAYYTDAEELEAEFPKLALRIEGDRILGAAALPLGDPAEPLGALWFRWPNAIEFDDRLTELLTRTAGALTAAIERERERADRERRLDELTQANRELESMSAVAAHDLKAPLRRVHSFVQLLGGEMGEKARSDKVSHYMTIIREQIEHMGRLVEDLLQYSATSRPEIEVTDFDLAGVIAEVEAILEPSTDDHRVEVKTGELPVLRGNRAMIAQLFSNLLENAVKYRHPDRPPRIEITATVEGDPERDPRWRVTVTDNGRGIAPELHEKIFAIFERGEPGDGSDGTGIGLAIVKRIVERHDGTVSVDSEPGVGSSFHVTLPGVPTAERI